MQPKLKRIVAGAAAFAAVAGGLLITAAPASAAAPAGGVTLNPTSGTSAASLTAVPPTGTVCPLDSASGSARWWGFIVPSTVDPATLTFTAAGPVAQPANPGYYSPLFDTFGNPLVNKATAATSGLINPIPSLNFSADPVPDGAYKLGYACTVGGTVLDFAAGSLGTTANPTLVGKSAVWVAPVTFSAGGYSYGSVPAAPSLGTITYDVASSTATVPFSHSPSTPVTTGYVATVTPAPTGGATINVAAGATSFQIPGLTLGTSYSVSLVANNTSGPSAPATATFPASAVGPLVTVVADDAFEGVDATVSWTIPTVPGVPAPASYDVTVTGPTTVTPFTAVAGPSVTLPASELTPGDYTATVTPNYAVGAGVAPNPGSDTFAVQVNTLLYQEITVSRPPGALVLTQKCGVYGALDPFTAVDAFPGFPRELTTFGTDVASTPGINPAPDTDISPAGDRTAGEYTADPNFGSYPALGAYPTECGLDMGTAQLVTSGNLAGQFYTADGRLNQVTVLDTRDVDAGWTARGDIEDVFTSGGNTFDGNYLGWIPEVTDDSDPVGGSTYDQVVTPGAAVLPGTGTTGASVPASPYSATGLKGNVPLAAAAPAAGLGIATLDARMQLLIPASANTGDYSATLSLTVA